MEPRYHSPFCGFLDCENHGPGSGAELILVEGESAGAAVSRVCNRRFQAVMPLQGKPRNALKSSVKMLNKSPIFGPLLKELQMELEAPIVIEQLRYERILFLFDPDADGIHCGMLMTWFFYRWLRPLLENGCIASIQAPRWFLEVPGSTIPAFSEKDLANKLGELSHVPPEAMIKRHVRGLASMSDEWLFRYCVDPTSRREYRLGIQDAELAIQIASNM